MAAVHDVLFQDDDLREMYCADNGRPSLPPSMMCGVMLLQFYDDVSDAEAVERLQFDLRWKVALHLPLDYAGFDPSSLTYFRQRLTEHGQERYAFDRLVAVGRAAGFIAGRVTLLIDGTPVKGAGAVQDTYTLLRKGIRKLLKAAGYQVPGKRQGLSSQAQALIKCYVDRDRKADIDWANAQQRAAQLKVLVADAEAALTLALEESDDPDVRGTGWLLTKILGDDVVNDAQGDPQIGQGTAPDRIVSVTEPEMRHGRKSKAQRFEGFKVLTTTDQKSELILDIQDTPASGSEGAQLLPAVERVEAHDGVMVERVIGDGAFGSGKQREACANHGDQPIDVVAPLAQPQDAEVAKSAFQIDLEAGTATCPRGQTTTGCAGPQEEGLPTWRFTFPRTLCEACPLFGRCVRSKVQGRSVCAGPFEAYLQAARARQQTEEFRQLYRLRPAIERKQAELVGHGLRKTRYLGEPKRQLQRLWIGAVVNLKRLFKLAEAQNTDLCDTMRLLRRQPRGATAMWVIQNHQQTATNATPSRRNWAPFVVKQGVRTAQHRCWLSSWPCDSVVKVQSPLRRGFPSSLLGEAWPCGCPSALFCSCSLRV
jgi:transposase